MAHVDELAAAYQRPPEAALAKETSGRSFDWAVAVVTFALGCTLAWICLLMWAAVRAFQMVLS